MPTRGFYAHAAADPDAPCLTDERVTRTRGQVRERIYRVANGLRALGLGPDDHLCLLMRNRVEFMEIVLGSGISGTLVTAVNWHLTPDEVAYIVDDCDASVLFVDPANAAVGLQAAGHARKVKTIVAVGGPVDGAIDLETWLRTQSPEPPADEVAGGQMLYSSGTTGRPKGVARRPYADDPDAALEVAERLRSYFPVREGGAYLVTGPLYHAAPFGYTVSAAHRGSHVVVMDRWTPEATLDLIERFRVDSLHLVPTMFRRLLDLPEERRQAFDSSSLTMALHGAAPCPPSVKRAMIRWWGPVVWEYYGATEGGLTLAGSEEWLQRPGTVGRALPFWEVMALDEEGNRLAPGQTGTIYFKALLGQTFEYYKDPGKTARAHRGADLFTLGDVGHVDAAGYVFITDRQADMIISGGVNVYPAEVESCLHAHPAVADVAVIGVPSDQWGEEVKAVVQPRAGHEPSPDLERDIIDFARDRIAHFKCPRSVDFVDALPRTDAGKLYKRRLRDRYWAQAGRAI